MAAAVLLLSLLGCSTPPPAPPPPVPLVAPGEKFFAAPQDAPSPSAADSAWWQGFGDPTLAAWVEQALAQNLDIAQARARADEARALLRVAQAQRAPQLAAQAGLQAGNRVGSPGDRLQASAALVLDWDTDLWGRLQWAQAGRAATAAQRQAELAASRLSTAALTARAYLGWVEAGLARQQLGQSIELQREVARVVQLRVQAGVSPALDGQRARGELAASQAQAVAADNRVLNAQRALQLLAGLRPGAPMPPSLTPPTLALPQLQSRQPVVLPADLLRLRPDLQAAEQAWRSAWAGLGEAQAASRPTLRLPGVLSLGAAASGQLLAQLTASIAAALSQPLLDGGVRAAGQEAANARLSAAAAAYQQRFQQALADVEAALSATALSAAQTAALQQAAAEADAAVADARTLYSNGLSGFLDLLEAQRTALLRQQSLLQSQGDAARASVASFEAMGLVTPDPSPAS